MADIQQSLHWTKLQKEIGYEMQFLEMVVKMYINNKESMIPTSGFYLFFFNVSASGSQATLNSFK